MASKHLRELLVEDQEPFLLESYISDRRRQLNKPPRPLLLHLKSTSFRQSFLKNANACFSSSSSRYCNHNNSSPLPPRFDAQAKTAGNNTVLLRVPKKTEALLLEAALRIENCNPKDRLPPDFKTQGKSGAGDGKVESLFRKFSKFGRWSRKKEFDGREGDDGVLVRDILRLNNSGDQQNQGKASTNKNTNTSKKKSSYVSNSPCSVSEQTEAPPEQRGGRESFCDSEVSDPKRSPFRYPTPELQSPAVSPTRSVLEDKVNYEENDPREIQPHDGEEVEKEQSSPVSVLDPPPLYDDDDNIREKGHTDDHDNDEYADGLDYEACFTRTKQQLLRKLYRFERLAGLDPVELEERMMEHDDSDDEDGDGGDSGAEVARKMRVTRGMMKSVSDLIMGDDHGGSTDCVIDIDNMVLIGCFRQHGMRRRDQEDHHLKDIAAEIEVSILVFLVEELSEELCLKMTFY